MREKLIELIHTKLKCIDIPSCSECEDYGKAAKCSIERLADYLIENGVVMPVRCENCIWRREDSNPDYHYCKLTGTDIWLDGFCSDGEPKESEE